MKASTSEFISSILHPEVGGWPTEALRSSGEDINYSCGVQFMDGVFQRTCCGDDFGWVA